MTQLQPEEQSTQNLPSGQRRLFIVLVDLSGYTELMVASQTAALHGQMVVSMLLEAILGEVDSPLHLQEIEGDAVFLYAEHPGSESAWRDVCEHIGHKLPRFFEAFAEAVVSMDQATMCSCAVCQNKGLRIKVVVHSGEAVFHSIQGRPQVSGVDVIKAHRLLKNSVPSNEYILLTKTADDDLSSSLDLKFTKGEEKYDGLGAISTFVHFPKGYETVRQKFYAQPRWKVAWAAVRFVLQGGGKSVKILFQKQRNPAIQVSTPRRVAYLALTALTMPFIMLAYPVVASIRLLIKQASRK